MTTTINMLNQAQFVKLGKWIEGNLDQLSPAHDTDVAIKATTALGFPVSERNIKSVCKAFDLTLARPKRVASTDSSSSSQFLAAAIVDLYKQLGGEAPRYVRLIATRHSLDAVREAYTLHMNGNSK